MLTEPITITLSGSPLSLNRVQDVASKPPYYRTEDETAKLEVSHAVSGKNRKRHNVRFERRKVVTDPLNSDKQDFDSASLMFSIDRPQYGFTVEDIVALKTAFLAFFTDSNVTKILGGQS